LTRLGRFFSAQVRGLSALAREEKQQAQAVNSSGAMRNDGDKNFTAGKLP
jgi:hypothetical protein